MQLLLTCDAQQVVHGKGVVRYAGVIRGPRAGGGGAGSGGQLPRKVRSCRGIYIYLSTASEGEKLSWNIHIFFGGESYDDTIKTRSLRGTIVNRTK